jgi:hypothetical protein
MTLGTNNMQADKMRVTAMTQVEDLWVLMPYSVVVVHQHFGGPCCLHLQGEMNGTGKKDINIGMGYMRGGSKVLQNLGILLQHCMVSQLKRPQISQQ